MSVVIKTRKVNFRDATHTDYIGVNAVAEKTTEDLVADVKTKAATIISDANNKISSIEDTLTDIITQADDSTVTAQEITDLATTNVNTAQSQLTNITNQATDILETTSTSLDTKKENTINYVTTTLDDKEDETLNNINTKFSETVAQLEAYQDEVENNIQALTASVATAIENGVDATLSLEGVPADAAAVSEKIDNIVTTRINNLKLTVQDNCLCVVMEE